MMTDEIFHPLSKVYNVVVVNSILGVNCGVVVWCEESIQGVTETSALILTGNRTHQKEQLFSLPFWRKTLRNGLKK
jgi:hypothetical protein